MRRQVTLPDETWRKTRIFALAAGISTSTLVQRAIEAWIADNFVETPLDMPAIPLAPEVIEERTRPPVAEVTDGLRFGFSRPAPKPLKRR